MRPPYTPTGGDPDSLGACIAELLDDPDRRARLGALGRERVEDELCWERSEEILLAAFARALEHRGSTLGVVREARVPADADVVSGRDLMGVR